LVSYSDFITLMFVVFVVLFSFASVDLAKYQALGSSLRSAMGPTDRSIAPLPSGGLAGQTQPVEPSSESGTATDVPDWPTGLIGPDSHPDQTTVTPPTETQPPNTQPTAEKPKPQAEETPKAHPGAKEPTPPTDPLLDLEHAFQSLPGARSGLLQVALEERGIVISIAGSVLFDEGQTTLKDAAKTYLQQVASSLDGVELPIMVSGTSDDASQQSGLSAWDLAALRAGSVVRYFVEQQGFPGSRFVTIGYGASSGSSTESSRVVTIVVMRKQTTP
jgi:chemotaxis protein MotB